MAAQAERKLCPGGRCDGRPPRRRPRFGV